jgi:hypothetical protein
MAQPSDRLIELDELEIYEDDTAVCRVCGCTNAQACAGGCFWVEEDLCSSCALEAA